MLRAMSEAKKIPSTDQVEILSVEIDRLSEVVSRLELAAKADAEPKVDRLQTMVGALKRDVHEAREETGADEEVVEKLYTQLRDETHRLSHEIGALAQGNPTTVSAVGDAGIIAIDAFASKVEETAERAIDAVKSGLKTAGDRRSKDDSE